MKGINYRSLIANWDAIIEKLCEECTPHDVLGVVHDHLNKCVMKFNALGVQADNMQRAIVKIEEAMKEIDPDGI